MKHSFFLFLVISFISCSKQTTTLQMKGELTGPDQALCTCCGGVILQLENSVGEYRIDSLPFMSRQRLFDPPFPKQISFDFTKTDTCGGIIRFTVTSYFVYN